MTQTIIQKLRLIADCIEQGKDVEYNSGEGWKPKKIDGDAIYISVSVEYRVKADKPRTAWHTEYLDSDQYKVIELTDEVHAVLSKAGIEY